MVKQTVLRSFLIGLGFKIDDQEWKKFDTYWHKISERFAELGVQAAASSLELAAAVTQISDELTNLYYTSQRTSTGVGGLQAFQFAAKRIGLTAEQATAALEGLSETMRMQPGTNGVLAQFGIDPKGDHLTILLKLVDVLRRMPFYQGAAYAKMFGIDQNTFLMLSQNFDQLKKGIELRNRMASQFGLTPQQLAAMSRQYQNDLGQISEEWKIFEMVLARDFLPTLDKVLHGIIWLLNKLGPLDKATGGWSTRILAVAAAFMSVAKAMSLLKWGFRLLKGGGIAAEGAGAAEGAAGAGAGLISLPAIVIAAVGAALVWMMVHPDKVRAAARKVWSTAKSVGSEVGAAVKSHPLDLAKRAAETALNLPIGALDGAGKKIAQGTQSLMDSLMARVMGVEGYRGKRYWDHGAYDIGFGHQLRPGENLSNLDRPGSERLLRGDLVSLYGNVSKVLKRKLNDHQMEAILDFAYNVGFGAFKGSTLLKDLNVGNFSAAALEFKRWNKVKSGSSYLVDQGLTNRRASEAQLFSSPVLHQETNIHIAGVSNPHAAAAEVQRKQNMVNGQLVRNMAGVVDTTIPASAGGN